jgi:hypothetical protein
MQVSKNFKHYFKDILAYFSDILTENTEGGISDLIKHFH